MGPELLLDVIFMKCENRTQQIGLAIGMGLFVIAFIAIGWWCFDMGQAAQTDAREMNSAIEMRDDHGLNRMMFNFYAGATVCGLLGLLCSLVGIVNLVRFLTFTGLKKTESY